MLVVSGCASDSFPVCPLVSPDDRLLAAVLGGCTLATLSHYNELQAASNVLTIQSLPQADEELSSSHYMYAVSQEGWLFRMFTKREHFIREEISRSSHWPRDGETDWYVDSDNGESYESTDHSDSSEDEEELSEEEVEEELSD